MLTDKPRLPIKSIALTGFLPSFLKAWVYRLMGYKIGRNVRFSLGSVVIGREVEIGDHSSLGFLSVLRGDRIKIGRHVEIRSMSIFDIPHLEIGDGTRINEQVFVGGLQYADSKLVIGRNCQIMQMTFINPARSITIGDDTGIGGHCLIFGHSSWLSQFEGYPVEFEPIEIGNSVSLTWRVFVLPGTKILDGAVIGANSLVRGTIPGKCLAVGFPARVVSREPDFPRVLTPADRENVLEDLLTDFSRFLKDYGFSAQRSAQRFDVVESTTGKAWTMQIARSAEDAPGASAVDVFLSLVTLTPERREQLDRQGIPWIDIESKDRSDQSNDFAEETIQFLRRYGVRFYRPGWPHVGAPEPSAPSPESPHQAA